MKCLNLIPFGFCLFLAFCSTEKQETLLEIPYQLEPGFSFVVPDHPSSTSSLQTKNIDGKEYLFWGDVKRFDRIYWYNITDNKWEQPIQFELQGPNGIGRLDGFYLKSLDSIFTVHSFGWKIYLMDQGQKINSFSTREGLDPMEVITPFTSENPLSGLIDDKLVLFGFPELSPKDLSYYDRGKTGELVNIETRETKVGANYPIPYRGHMWPGVNTISDRQEVVGDLIAHSFSLSDTVFLYDNEYNLIRKIRMHSSKKQVTNSFDVEGFEVGAGEKGYVEMLSKGFYSGIIADEKNGILYRTISYSDFEPSNFSSYQEYKQSAKRGLIIFDLNNNELVGEIFFQPGEVDEIPMMVVGEKGLYLSKRNPLEEGVEFRLLTW